MCTVSPFDGVEAACSDLRYPPFSLTKLRRGRAYATCSLPQYRQTLPAAAHLVTSRRELWQVFHAINFHYHMREPSKRTKCVEDCFITFLKYNKCADAPPSGS